MEYLSSHTRTSVSTPIGFSIGRPSPADTGVKIAAVMPKSRNKMYRYDTDCFVVVDDMASTLRKRIGASQFCIGSYDFSAGNLMVLPFIDNQTLSETNVVSEEQPFLFECLSKSSIIRTELYYYLSKVYSLESEGKHREASKVIFQFIEIQIEKSNMQSLNSFLGVVSLQNLSEWSISGLVRFTARARNHLSAWSKTYKLAISELEKRGLDHKKLLIGITE